MKSYKNEEGKTHRENNPAIVYAMGGCSWWANGQRHRYYGPAVTWFDNSDMYFIFNEQIQ